MIKEMVEAEEKVVVGEEVEEKALSRYPLFS